MKTLFLNVLLTLVLVCTSCQVKGANGIEPAFAKAETKNTTLTTTSNTIKVALLLDTSNSMDGLIDQAKAQLWELVNELGKAHCDDNAPTLNIALYEYGNSRLNAEEGYIKQISAFTQDLDELSQSLFKMTTSGGEEYCGMVVQKAIKDLNWGKEPQDLNFIFIAGNEPFTQGPVNYKEATSNASSLDITVNTIFCGSYAEGVNTQWKNGADLTKGSYIAINQDHKVAHIPSPYDDIIITKNTALNKTYIAYGAQGASKMALQSEQDANANEYGSANVVKRAVAKSSRLYKNKSWDLVDAADDADFEYEEVVIETLPNELKEKTPAQLEAYVNEKKEARTRLQNEIAALNKKRQEYVAKKQQQTGKEALGSALIKAIKKQAAAKNYTFKE